MNKIIFVCLFSFMFVFNVFANSNVTLSWDKNDPESDLKQFYVYKAVIEKGATTGNHILKKYGGIPNATIPYISSGTSQVTFSDQPDGFYAFVVTAADDMDNESDKSEESISRIDTTPPVIILNGSPNISLERGASYTDAGANATDNLDGDLTSKIVMTGTVNTGTVGRYELTYTVSDETPLIASVTRVVKIIDNSPPTPPTNVKTTWQRIIAWLMCNIFRSC